VVLHRGAWCPYRDLALRRHRRRVDADPMAGVHVDCTPRTEVPAIVVAVDARIARKRRGSGTGSCRRTASSSQRPGPGAAAAAWAADTAG
jgi:hypothetical protein